MKRIATTLLLIAATAATAAAQTLHVVTGQVTYDFPASQAGTMLYQQGTTLTIMGKAFATADITRMYVDQADVTDNSVSVSYDGTQATVRVAGNIARYVEPTVSGAHVALAQSSEVSDSTCGEITYTLAGSSTDGAFALTGTYKATLELCGLTLTSASGAALDLQDGKRINLSIKKGTDNTLADAAGGTQKGCIACKGHLELKGKGTLHVKGATAHAIYAKEYVEMKNCTVDITAAVKDGINCNQYFLMESGTLTISGVADDGIQVSYKDDTDREAEDTGALTVTDGTITVASTAKGIKAAGNVTIDGGTITVDASGSKAEGIESKAVLTINGGTVNVTAYDDAINSGSHMYINGGVVTAVAKANDGLDANGNLYVNGGTIMAFGTTSPECGIDANEEEGYTVVFTGGTLLAVGGGNSTPSTSASTQPYVSGSLSVAAGNVVTLTNGTDTLATFTVPATYTGSSQQGGGRAMAPGGGSWGPGGGPGGGSWGGGSSSVLVTCEGLTSGSSYTLANGTSSSSVTARTSGSSQGGRW